MGMRHAASQLRSKAERVTAVANRLDADVAALIFTGPAADRFRGSMAREVQDLRTVARVMNDTAATLTKGAADVEADPAGFYGDGRS